MLSPSYASLIHLRGDTAFHLKYSLKHTLKVAGFYSSQAAGPPWSFPQSTFIDSNLISVAFWGHSGDKRVAPSIANSCREQGSLSALVKWFSPVAVLHSELIFAIAS